MKRSKLFLFLYLVFVVGCATPTFNVKSDPLQADIYFKTSKNPEKKSLGRTPLSMPMADLKQALGEEIPAGQYFTLIVEKQDYLPETVTVPVSRFGTILTEIQVSLKKGNDLEASKLQEQKTAKGIVDSLFLAQRFALTQQFERAHIELDKVIKDFPKFARAFSMRASIYFVQKNYAESLKWYEEALKFDPEMEEAVKMSAKVRTLLGERAPAAEKKL